MTNSAIHIIKALGFEVFYGYFASDEKNQNTVLLRCKTPEGNTWDISLDYDGTNKGLVEALESEIQTLGYDQRECVWKKAKLRGLFCALRLLVEQMEKSETDNNLDMPQKETSEAAIFFDMDGTLAKWNKDASIEEVMEPGYFKERTPMHNMIRAAKVLIRRGYRVYITSKVFTGTTAVEDKNEWLDRFLPEVTREHRFFIPYENRSKNAIPLEGGVKPGYVLVDDSTHHGLAGWAGIGVKVDNGINNNKRSWDGYMVSAQSTPNKIANTIEAIMLLEEKRSRNNGVSSGYSELDDLRSIEDSFPNVQSSQNPPN